MRSRQVWGDVRLATRLVVGLAALAATSGGCKRRDGLIIETSNEPGDGSADRSANDGGRGDGASGAGGGGGGGMGGSPGDTRMDTGPCLPPRPMPEICNGIDDDCNGIIDDVPPSMLQSDLENCGACGKICAPPNSIPECSGGQCHIKGCQTGTCDTNGDVNDGCECVLTAGVQTCGGGGEICDGIDNDCNGKTDEGFDLKTDPANCGKCGNRCDVLFPFAEALCVDGACKMGKCLPGFWDLDPSKPGCEYNCIPSPDHKEVCNGADDDCNGLTDDGVSPPAPCPKSLGVCAGVTPECKGTAGWVCDYTKDGRPYEEVETKKYGCDGKDNDCNGQTDEPYDIGKSCPLMSGMCASTGQWACDSTKTGHFCSGTPKVPMPEVCNGLDDDCDGKIDEIETLQDVAGPSSPQVVFDASKNVTIFVYEASRNDATATTAGSVSCPDDPTKACAAPCSVPGRLPWANITKEEAQRACQQLSADKSWRLCTDDEWGSACRGSSASNVFPYGTTFNPTLCNGADYCGPAGTCTPSPIPTGQASACVSDLGGGLKLLDMSGNVKEWVLTTATAGTFELRGGAYNNISFGLSAPALQCDATTPAPDVPVRLPSVGFRCCRPGQLPAGP